MKPALPRFDPSGEVSHLAPFQDPGASHSHIE
jgi:hypothetical protein